MAVRQTVSMTEKRVGNSLLVVDAQRGFFEGPSAIADASKVEDAIRTLVADARTAGVVIVHVQNDGPPGAVDEPGTSGWQLVIAPLDHEVVIRKTGDDAFRDTDLAAVLKRHSVEIVVVAGVLSEMCVSAAARGAIQNGFDVVLPHDAHGTYPIAEVDGVSEAVPAHHVVRVAEWALGDDVAIVKAARDVRFARP